MWLPVGLYVINRPKKSNYGGNHQKSLKWKPSRSTQSFSMNHWRKIAWEVRLWYTLISQASTVRFFRLNDPSLNPCGPLFGSIDSLSAGSNFPKMLTVQAYRRSWFIALQIDTSLTWRGRLQHGISALHFGASQNVFGLSQLGINYVTPYRLSSISFVVIRGEVRSSPSICVILFQPVVACKSIFLPK